MYTKSKDNTSSSPKHTTGVGPSKNSIYATELPSNNKSHKSMWSTSQRSKYKTHETEHKQGKSIDIDNRKKDKTEEHIEPRTLIVDEHDTDEEDHLYEQDTRYEMYDNYDKRYKRYKSFKKNVYCSNCNGKGHVFKECKKPIKSFGIIAFRVVPKTENNPVGIEVCLIRRKNTISYEAFIRGKYKIDELNVHLKRMTKTEKCKIKQLDWETLYNELCFYRISKHSQRERKKAKDAYDALKIMDLFDDTRSEWDVPEWEFPKGRKYYGETQEECALREFREETNINESLLKLINTQSFFETFEGTNKRIYQNQYFLAIVSSDANEPYLDLGSRNQITEIGDVDWFPYNDSIDLIRNYHSTKKQILTDAYRIVSSYI